MPHSSQAVKFNAVNRWKNYVGTGLRTVRIRWRGCYRRKLFERGLQDGFDREGRQVSARGLEYSGEGMARRPGPGVRGSKQRERSRAHCSCDVSRPGIVANEKVSPF